MSDIENKPGSKISKIIIIMSAIVIAAFVGGYFIGTNSVEPQILYINDVNNESQEEQPRIQASMDDDPIFGNPSAPITIIEFSDFQCPFCARFHTETQGMIMKNYVETGKAKLVYRDFPLNSHKNALIAAVAAECANEQGKFWQYHDVLFSSQNNWAKLESGDAIEAFKQYSTDLELSTEFANCLDSGRYISEIQNDLRDGVSYGVSGTPSFFIGNEKIGYMKIDGAKPYEAFASVLDSISQ